MKEIADDVMNMAQKFEFLAPLAEGQRAIVMAW